LDNRPRRPAALSWGFPGAAANTVIAVVVILAIRLAALRWGLSLPTFSPRESADRDGDGGLLCTASHRG